MSRLEKVLFVPDAHIPYHDKRAWDLMIRIAKDLSPDSIVTIGDLADFFGVSNFSKDPNRALKLHDEVEEVNKSIDELDSLGATTKIFIAGNHCDRLRRYLQDRAPELFNFINIANLFKLKERGWEYVPYKSDTKLGHLYLTHDVGQIGRYAAYRCLDAYQHSVVTGHTHRFAYVVEGDAAGGQKVSAQFGWLGDVEQADYMHQIQARKNWALGFGIGYKDKQSDLVYLTPVPIVDYSCVVEGELYYN